MVPACAYMLAYWAFQLWDIVDRKLYKVAKETASDGDLIQSDGLYDTDYAQDLCLTKRMRIKPE